MSYRAQVVPRIFALVEFDDQGTPRMTLQVEGQFIDAGRDSSDFRDTFNFVRDEVQAVVELLQQAQSLKGLGFSDSVVQAALIDIAERLGFEQVP